ncbi:MAG: hypothetical protein GY757_05625 [bacterium]|nr:hypothetical protein [bacterium]
MKNEIKYVQPPLFALFCILLYIFAFRPAQGTESFTTALITFFGGLGWSAVLILSHKKRNFFYYFYLILSLGGPIFLLAAYKMPHSNEQWFISGLIALSAWTMRLFVIYHYKNLERKK